MGSVQPVLDLLEPVAANAGFRRRGRLFVKEDDNAAAVVAVKPGKRGLDFAVRGGVSYKLWTRILSRRQRDPVDEADVPLEIVGASRIGTTTERRWTFAVLEHDATGVSVEIGEAVKKQLLEPGTARLDPQEDRIDLASMWKETRGELPTGDALGRLYMWLFVHDTDDELRSAVHAQLTTQPGGSALAARVAAHLRGP